MSQSLPADSTKIWSERHGSFLSFDEELPAPRKESEVSLLSNQLKELEDKTQEILYLQQELNESNASLKEEKWYSAALKEEVDKITKEKVELEEKNSLLEKVFWVLFSKTDILPPAPFGTLTNDTSHAEFCINSDFTPCYAVLNFCAYFVSEGMETWK